MTARDRRIIHLTVESNPEVTSYSKGEKDDRRVIVALKTSLPSENEK